MYGGEAGPERVCYVKSMCVCYVIVINLMKLFDDDDEDDDHGFDCKSLFLFISFFLVGCVSLLRRGGITKSEFKLSVIELIARLESESSL